jgi:hypothetical protein
MKMTVEDYAILKNAVESSPVYPQLLDYRDRGLSDKRYRWDCVWSVHSSLKEWFDNVYQYANDDHIDTALRKITETK